MSSDNIPTTNNFFRIDNRLYNKNNISLIICDDQKCKIFLNDNIPVVCDKQNDSDCYKIFKQFMKAHRNLAKNSEL